MCKLEYDPTKFSHSIFTQTFFHAENCGAYKTRYVWRMVTFTFFASRVQGVRDQVLYIAQYAHGGHAMQLFVWKSVHGGLWRIRPPFVNLWFGFASLLCHNSTSHVSHAWPLTMCINIPSNLSYACAPCYARRLSRIIPSRENKWNKVWHPSKKIPVYFEVSGIRYAWIVLICKLAWVYKMWHVHHMSVWHGGDAHDTICMPCMPTHY